MQATEKIVALVMVCALMSASHAVEPVDPDLIPEGRALLNYLESVYKQKTVTAIAGERNRGEIYECTGKQPAILSEDMTGWNGPKYGDDGPGSYSAIMEKTLKALLAHHERGGILEVHFHWPNPLSGNAGFSASKEELTDAQWNNIIKPGTNEYKKMIDDLDWHIDRLLKPLAEKNIPVLWRPLHEINGGWFWWTCENDPAKTAELWRILFDHMTNIRGLHNLIWVYNDAKYNDGLEWRVPYKPGAEYYDIASIDLYRFDARNSGVLERSWTTDLSFRLVFDMMEKLHPGKMIALGEVQEIPNMEKTASGDPAFAPWLWACPWWMNDNGDANCVNKPCNPCSWAKETYLHDFAVTLDELDNPVEQQVTAAFTSNVTSGFAPLEVQLDASDSWGEDLTYTWDYGDGTTGSGQSVTHTFDNPGAFSITLTVTDGARSDTETLDVKIEEATSLPDTLTIDDAETGSGSNQFDFSSGWDTAPTSGAYQSSEHYSRQTGASYSITFYGVQVSLYATVDAHHGIAEVAVDNGTAQDADYYAAQRQEQALVYTSPVLEQGVHTITVTVSGRKNSASSGNVIVADGVVICTNAATTTANRGSHAALRKTGARVGYDVFTLDGKLVGSTAEPLTVQRVLAQRPPHSVYIVRLRRTGGTGRRILRHSVR